MAMERVNFRGKTLNKRTVKMIERLEFNILRRLDITQGSYNSGGVSQSAGTHDGGGAVDFWTHGLTEKEKTMVIKEARKVGFAWWLRRAIPGLWNEHFHGIAMNDPEASSGAKAQMVAFRNRRNGLANNGPDDGPWVGVHSWPVKPTKKVNVWSARRQFKARKPKKNIYVKRIQWVLNEKMNAGLLVDGVAGGKTRRAYLLWEKKVGVPRPNGVPGPNTIRELGKGRFKTGMVAWLANVKKA